MKIKKQKANVVTVDKDSEKQQHFKTGKVDGGLYVGEEKENLSTHRIL